VTAELAIVLDADDVFSIFRIVVSEVHQNVQFNTSLVLKFQLVTDYLDRHNFLRFMVFAFDGLAEAALAKKINYLKSKSEVISDDNLVVTLVIIVTIITRLSRFALNFLIARQPYKIHSLILEQLGFFEISQLAATSVLF